MGLKIKTNMSHRFGKELQLSNVIVKFDNEGYSEIDENTYKRLAAEGLTDPFPADPRYKPLGSNEISVDLENEEGDDKEITLTPEMIDRTSRKDLISIAKSLDVPESTFEGMNLAEIRSNLKNAIFNQ